MAKKVIKAGNIRLGNGSKKGSKVCHPNHMDRSDAESYKNVSRPDETETNKLLIFDLVRDPQGKLVSHEAELHKGEAWDAQTRYYEMIKPAWDAQNARYKKAGQYKNIRDYEYLRSRDRPEEVERQVDKEGRTNDAELLWKAEMEYEAALSARVPGWTPIAVAGHFDELTNHIHCKEQYLVQDKDGNWKVNKAACLKAAGFVTEKFPEKEYRAKYTDEASYAKARKEWYTERMTRKEKDRIANAVKDAGISEEEAFEQVVDPKSWDKAHNATAEYSRWCDELWYEIVERVYDVEIDRVPLPEKNEENRSQTEERLKSATKIESEAKEHLEAAKAHKEGLDNAISTFNAQKESYKRKKAEVDSIKEELQARISEYEEKNAKFKPREDSVKAREAAVEESEKYIQDSMKYLSTAAENLSNREASLSNIEESVAKDIQSKHDSLEEISKEIVGNAAEFMGAVSDAMHAASSGKNNLISEGISKVQPIIDALTKILRFFFEEIQRKHLEAIKKIAEMPLDGSTQSRVSEIVKENKLLAMDRDDARKTVHRIFTKKFCEALKKEGMSALASQMLTTEYANKFTKDMMRLYDKGRLNFGVVYREASQRAIDVYEGMDYSLKIDYEAAADKVELFDPWGTLLKLQAENSDIPGLEAAADHFKSVYESVGLPVNKESIDQMLDRLGVTKTYIPQMRKSGILYPLQSINEWSLKQAHSSSMDIEEMNAKDYGE